MTTKTVSYYLVPVAAVLGAENNPTDQVQYWSIAPQARVEKIDRIEPEPDQDVPAWLQRVLVERSELAEKVEKLDHFLHTLTEDSMNDKARGKLWAQLSAMRDYLKILDDRIADYGRD